MKLFNSIKKWFGNQENLFYLFLFVLIVPNVVLCFTEPLPLVAKIANVLLPLGCYYLIMTLSRNCGKMLWILFLFVFFGAFQIVLLYLFGQSIIAVDMFLNLATTNFFRSHGVTRQPVAGFDYDCDPVHPGPDTGDDLHCP